MSSKVIGVLGARELFILSGIVLRYPHYYSQIITFISCPLRKASDMFELNRRRPARPDARSIRVSAQYRRYHP